MHPRGCEVVRSVAVATAKSHGRSRQRQADKAQVTAGPTCVSTSIQQMESHNWSHTRQAIKLSFQKNLGSEKLKTIMVFADAAIKNNCLMLGYLRGCVKATTIFIASTA